MLSWLKKILNTGAQEDVSPGGSRMYRYEGDEFGRSQPGFPEEDTSGYGEAREAVYGELFGESGEVLHEMMPFAPHIDVFRYPPGNNGRDFWTLVTSGMSDMRMTLPEDLGPEYSRVELIFYCDEPKEDYLELLRVMAHFPHDNKTWLGHGHTMPNGNPPQPLFEHTPDLNSLLFSGTIVQPDETLDEKLKINGDPVNFLWLVPLTDKECQAKLDYGMEYIYDLFDKFEHPPVFSGNRKSYV